MLPSNRPPFSAINGKPLLVVCSRGVNKRSGCVCADHSHLNVLWYSCLSTFVPDQSCDSLSTSKIGIGWLVIVVTALRSHLYIRAKRLGPNPPRPPHGEIWTEITLSARCYPLKLNEEGMWEGKECFYSGKKATHMAIFARAF